MSSVLVRLRSTARRGAPAPRGSRDRRGAVAPERDALAVAALDPDHWHFGDPRRAPSGDASAGGPVARPAVPSPRPAPQDALIHLPADGPPQLVGARAGGPARGPAAGSSRAPAQPDPSTWFS